MFKRKHLKALALIVLIVIVTFLAYFVIWM